MSWRVVVGLGAVVVLMAAPSAWAWGPATHIKLAGDILNQLHLLPVAVAALLARHRKDFLFGNIAADVVLAKRLSRVKQICHHWNTGLAILDDAQTDCGRAFALGYLSHLAADTVAHGKFIPRQMAMSRSTLLFGHLYWEMRADAMVGPRAWRQLRALLQEVFSEHEVSLHARLTDTFLPFVMNWQLFYRMNRFMSQALWRRTMYRWSNVSRWYLPEQLMREYRAECIERMRDVLSHERESAVLHDDPNGNAALSHARLRRRQFRQMSRAGLIAPHILYEAAAGHAPTVKVNVDAHRRAKML